jgi:hypothetical protein
MVLAVEDTLQDLKLRMLTVAITLLRVDHLVLVEMAETTHSLEKVALRVVLTDVVLVVAVTGVETLETLLEQVEVVL